MLGSVCGGTRAKYNPALGWLVVFSLPSMSKPGHEKSVKFAAYRPHMVHKPSSRQLFVGLWWDPGVVLLQKMVFCWTELLWESNHVQAERTMCSHHHIGDKLLWKRFLLRSGMKMTYSLSSFFLGQSHFSWCAWWFKFPQDIFYSSSVGLFIAHKAGKTQMHNTDSWVQEATLETLIWKPCTSMFISQSFRLCPQNLSHNGFVARFPVSPNSCPLSRWT